MIDEFGFYVNDPENRIAVAPYYSYNTLAEVEDMLEVCAARGDAADILACMIPGGYHEVDDTLDFDLDARDAIESFARRAAEASLRRAPSSEEE